MQKLIRKIEKNLWNYSLATIFFHCWFVGAFSYIKKNPYDSLCF